MGDEEASQKKSVIDDDSVKDETRRKFLTFAGAAFTAGISTGAGLSIRSLLHRLGHGTDEPQHKESTPFITPIEPAKPTQFPFVVVPDQEHEKAVELARSEEEITPAVIRRMFPEASASEITLLQKRLTEQFDQCLSLQALQFAPLTTPYKDTNLEALIASSAVLHNISPKRAKGLFSLECGNDVDNVAFDLGAGVGQIEPDVGRALGLKVPDKAFLIGYDKQPDPATDERLDPRKNIPAAMKLLAQNTAQFGDELYGIDAYNAGFGTVRKFLGIYSNNYITAADGPDKIAHYVSHEKLPFYRLLEDKRVQAYIDLQIAEKKMWPVAKYYVYRDIVAGMFWGILDKYRTEGKSTQTFIADFAAAKTDYSTRSKFLTYINQMG